MLTELKFALDKQDIDESLKRIISKLMACSSSLLAIHKDLEQWPHFQTLNDIPYPNELISLNTYITIFKNAIQVLEQVENIYSPIKIARANTQKARAAFLQAKSNKSKTGPQIVLEAAKTFQACLQKQREIETHVLTVIVHQWRSTINTIHIECQQIAAAKYNAKPIKMPSLTKQSDQNTTQNPENSAPLSSNSQEVNQQSS